MSSKRHIAKPRGTRTFSHRFEALCGDPDAALFALYPLYFERDDTHNGNTCQECKNHPDYALILLAEVGE